VTSWPFDGSIPRALMCVLARAGHLANLEEPEAFNRLPLERLTTRPALEGAGAPLARAVLAEEGDG
jgi:hypothetical protein